MSCEAVETWYIVDDATTHSGNSLTFKPSGGTGTTLSVKAIDISEDPENSDVSSANTNVLVTIQNHIFGVKGAGLA